MTHTGLHSTVHTRVHTYFTRKMGTFTPETSRLKSVLGTACLLHS